MVSSPFFYFFGIFVERWTGDKWSARGLPPLAEEESEEEEEDPSYKPSDDEPVGSKPQAKGKGRELVWTALEGDERCAACIGKGSGPCRVEMDVVQKWKEDLAAGKTFKRAPTGTVCEGCRGKKQSCFLPQVKGRPEGAELKRKRAESVADEAGPVAGGSKEGAPPAAKRARVRAEVIPAWVEEMKRMGNKIGKELRNGRRETKRVADAQERIALALEDIADGLQIEYYPQLDSDAGSEEDEGEVEEELAEEVAGLAEERAEGEL